MSRTSTTLKRLGVGSVSVCTLLATPYLGAVANAAAPAAGTPASVTIASQSTSTGSTRNDGTNTTVKISATTTPPGTGAAAVAGVRFSYQVGAATPVVIGTDTTAPYAVEWTPPAAGTYTEIAEAIDAANTVIDSDTQTAAVSDLSSVHITSPVDGGSIGSFGGNIVVSGTRSSDLPAIAVSAQTRDNSSGTLTVAGATANVVQGAPAAGADQTWTAIVAAPACVNSVTAGDCDIVITAVATGTGVNGTSDEVVESKLYAQTLTTFTVAPATATKPVNSPQTYVVTAQDQNGKPIAGLTVNVTDSSATASETPATGTTDAKGQFSFVGQNSAAETATYTVKSQIGAAFDPAVDFTRTATLTTYVSTPTTLTLSAVPAKTIYASQSEYTASTSVASPGTPVVDVCVVDQNGQGTPNAAAPPANLVTTVTRTTTTGAVVSGPTTTTVTPVQDTRTGKENCYLIPHQAAAGDFGQDVFNAYYENNGTPGFQAGSSDVSAAALTLKFATLDITTTNTQAQQGTSATVTFTVKGLDGTPFANRKLALSLSGTDATFPTTGQPAGTTYTGPGAAVCTTDANGQCSVLENDPTAGGDTVTATDSITDATTNQIATGDSATANVAFRTNSVALTDVDQVAFPTIITPFGNNPGFFDDAQPGDAVQATYQLSDVNGGALAGVSATLSLDHGFFTPTCTGTTYTGCTFSPAIADGAPVGNLKSNGSTATVTTDSSGRFTVTIGIGRDAGFDDDGNVAVSLSVKSGSATVVNGPANNNSGSYYVSGFSTDGNNTGNDPYNGASVKIVANSATDKLSGDVQLPNGTNFIVEARDQFGNLVTTSGCDIALTATGKGQLSQSCTDGSFTGNKDVINLDSTTTSLAGESSTVTATWPAPVTTFKNTAVAPATPVYTVNSATANKTDSFTVNLYVIDLQNLQYAFGNTPDQANYAVNTAVTTTATVKDQKGNPVQGQCVQFVRSGPNDTAGNSQTGGTSNGCVFTNAQGKAGTTYSSGTPGTATVTAIVKDGSGNELSRGVVNTVFVAGTPTATAPTVSLTSSAINPGKFAALIIKGKPGQVVSVFAQTAPATSFTEVRHNLTIPASGTLSVSVTPRRNTQLYAATGTAASNVVTLYVRPAIALKATVSGKSAAFSGSIVPGVSGSRVRVFSVSNGVLKFQGETFTTSGGVFSIPAKAFAVKAGQTVQFLAQTTTNANNLSGQSPRINVTFG